MTAALESGVFQQARAKSFAAEANTVGLTGTKVERATTRVGDKAKVAGWRHSQSVHDRRA